jgi:hypothetical protein
MIFDEPSTINHQPTTMNSDSATIDRIVAGVLNQLAGSEDGAPNDPAAVIAAVPNRGGRAESVSITDNVVTAQVLLAHVNGEARIAVRDRAVVTPAAWDAARERGIEIVRASTTVAERGSAKAVPAKTQGKSAGVGLPQLFVVHSTDGVERLWEDIRINWQRELLGCPDDAAAQATSAICRGETSTVAILATQTHRAACLANRNEQVKAVAIRDAGDVRTIRKQLRANVWCFDPTERSWFELRTLLRAITNH